MASQTEIINAALLKLGEDPVASIDEDSAAGHLAKRTFSMLRDAVLSSHTWNFAIRRASLAVNATAPTWGYTQAYNLPSGPDAALRVLEVNGEDETTGKWKVEGRTIVTDLSTPLEIRYIARTDIYGDYPPLFSEALASRLAYEWAIGIDGHVQDRQIFGREYREKIAEARSADGQEGIPDAVEANLWINSRF